MAGLPNASDEPNPSATGEGSKAHLIWYACLVATAVIGVGVVAWGQSPLADLFAWLNVRRHGAFLGVLFAGASIAQLTTAGLRSLAAKLSALNEIAGMRNQWPQRMLGVIESIGYAVSFAMFPADKVVPPIGAWIVFKQFGGWARWSQFQKPEGEGSRDEPRRRYYVFLFANAVQVGGAVVVGRCLKWALRLPG